VRADLVSPAIPFETVKNAEEIRQSSRCNADQLSANHIIAVIERRKVAEVVQTATNPGGLDGLRVWLQEDVIDLAALQRAVHKESRGREARGWH
jgi:hypothetical protein